MLYTAAFPVTLYLLPCTFLVGFLGGKTKYRKKLVMGAFAETEGGTVHALCPGNKKQTASVRRTFSLFLRAGSWHSPCSSNPEAEAPFAPSSPAGRSGTEDVAGIPGVATQDLPTVSPGTGKFFCN